MTVVAVWSSAVLSLECFHVLGLTFRTGCKFKDRSFPRLDQGILLQSPTFRLLGAVIRIVRREINEQVL